MPERFVQFGKQWEEMHPDWTLIEWNDAPRWLRNRQAYNAAKSPAEACDVLRYELLLTYGGVYIDVDFQPLKPLDELIDGLDCWSASEAPGVVSIGIMGAVPGHPLFQDVVFDLKRSAAEPGHVTSRTGPRFFTMHCEMHPEVKIFGPEVFYPLGFGAAVPAGAVENPQAVWPVAYGIHWWNGSYLSHDETIPWR
jgi:mannosyltransferase OCH1-like enzyme